MISLPGYTIVGEVGRGGMATVYRARQTLLDREVALKVLSPQLTRSHAHAERFLQEARLLAALEHPHVVRVFDVGVSPDGLHYFSMQLLTGGDLGSHLREGMSEAELVRVLEAVGGALGFAHERGYVHRDVTPANILFDLHGEPVLTDFGIARVMSAPSRLTPTGLSIGTGRYMSPEQAQGLEVDRRSDIYSLGIVTYEAVAGQVPFEGDDAFAIAMAHIADPVPPLPEECARWQPVIDGCLAKDPAQRYADASEFLAALQRALPELYPAPRPVSATALPKPGKKRRAAGATSAGTVPAARGPGRVLAWAAAAGIVASVLVAWTFWPTPEGNRLEPAATAVAGASPPQRAPALPSPAPGTAPAGATGATADGAVTAEAAFLDPAELPTVRDPVPVLLALADADLAALRLTIPPQTNALERYRLALRFDPQEPRARAGLAAVGSAYIALADALDPATRQAEWLQMLERAESVAASHPGAAAAAGAAAERRQRHAVQLVALGDAASARWDAAGALAHYRDALAVSPGLPAAEQGLAEAERIGVPGFGFADALAGGGRGPSMVLLGEIAMSRTELSVAEFRSYWDAAGAKRFAAAMPACRDRERGFLFGASSKRSWQAPDVPGGDRFPVVCVNYPMAEAYAAWLSAQSGARYRLPSAAEWRAARGKERPACTASNRRDAAFRTQFGGREGGSCDDGHATLAPVASFAPRRPGLYDLDGNVREWVADCGSGCGERLALGGAWLIDDGGGAAFDADKGYNSIGIRLVRDWTGEPRHVPLTTPQ